MTVIKHNGFRAPYNSLTFRNIAGLTAGRSGLVEIQSKITEDLVTINIPPFSIIQEGLLITKDTFTGISKPNLPAPYYLVVSAPTPNKINDLIFTFAKTPSDITENEVLIASNDGAEWKTPPLLSLYGLQKIIENQNIATSQIGPSIGLKTDIFEGQYRNAAGSLTDKNGQAQVFTQPALFDIIADDPDYSRVDRIVYRRPKDSENRVGVRKIITGNAYAEEPSKLYPIVLSGAADVSQKPKILVSPDNRMIVLSASGYGSDVKITLQTIAEDRQSVEFGPVIIAESSSSIYDAVITKTGIVYVVFQVEGYRLRLLRFNINTNSVAGVTNVTDALQPRVCIEPSIKLSPLQDRLFIVYRFHVAAGNTRIYFKSVNASGATVTDSKDISANAGQAVQPNIYVTDDFYLYVTWMVQANGAIMYRLFDDIGVSLPVMTSALSVSAATSSVEGALVHQGSAPHICVNDMKEVYVSFLQKKANGKNGLAIWTAGFASMMHYTDVEEDILGYDLVLDDVLGGYMVDLSTLTSTKMVRIHKDTVLFDLALSSSGSGNIALAKDLLGAFYHAVVDAYSGSFSIYQGNVPAKAIGPGLVSGSNSSVNLDASQALFFLNDFTGQLPRISERIVFSGSTLSTNNVAKIIVGIDVVSFNEENDSYRLSFETPFAGADSSSSIRGQFASRDGNGSTGFKSVGDTFAQGYLNKEPDSDILLSRIALPGPSILNWAAGINSAGSNQTFIIPQGGTEVTWVNNVLTLAGDPLKLTNIYTNEKYTVDSGSFAMEEGEAIYVLTQPSDKTPTPVVTTVSRLPWEQPIACLGFIEDGTFKAALLSAGGISEIVNGETAIMGEDLPKALRERLGFDQGDSTLEGYSSLNYIAASESFPEAISHLDEALANHYFMASQNKDLRLIGGSPWTWNLATSTLSWESDFYLSIPGVDSSENVSGADFAVLANGQFLYAEFDRQGLGDVDILSLGIASDLDNIDFSNAYQIARRVGPTIQFASGKILLPGQGGSAYADASIVDVRCVDVEATSLPTGIGVVVDEKTIEEGDAVFFMRESLNGIYVATNVATSIEWEKVKAFRGSDAPYTNAVVSVREGSYNANSVYLFDSFGWRDIANADVTFDPTGFEDPAQTDIAFNDISRTFTISPRSDKFFFYTQGCRHRRTAPDQVQIPDAEGFFFIAYDGDKLSVFTFYDVKEFRGYAFVASVYWDASNKKSVLLGDERHGVSMDWATRDFLHKTIGTSIVSGGAIGNYTTAGTGAVAADATVSLSGMSLRTQDLYLDVEHALSPNGRYQQNLQPKAQIPVIYRDGASGAWRIRAANDYPLYSGTARIRWNNPAASWAQPDAGQGNFVAMWLFGTNDPRQPVVALLGQREDSALPAAILNNQYTDLLFGVLPSQGLKGIYRLIYQTSTTYANAPHAKLVDVVDLRTTKDLGTRSVIAQSHPELLNRNAVNSHPATAISVNGLTLSGILPTATDDLQEALEGLSAYEEDFKALFQDRNTTVQGGGDWTWDGSAGTLSTNAEAFINVPGAANIANRVAPFSLVMAPNTLAYVKINRSGTAAVTLAAATAASLSAVVYDRTLVFLAFRGSGSYVLLANGSSLLTTVTNAKKLESAYSNQNKALFGSDFNEAQALAGYAGKGSPLRAISAGMGFSDGIASLDREMDRFFGILNLKVPTLNPAQYLQLTSAQVTMLSGYKRTTTLNGKILTFPGVMIKYSSLASPTTGQIFTNDQSTLISTFTIPAMSTGVYCWFSLSLNAASDQADNTTTATLAIQAGTPNAVLASASLPEFSGSKPVGQFLLQATATAGVYTLVDIRELGAGSGDGGGGDGAGEINYLPSALFDFATGSVTAVATYNDGDVSIPVDGTGGVASGRLTRAATNLNPLYGAYSLKISKGVGSARGEGISVDGIIPYGYRDARLNKVSFMFESAAGYVNGDVGIYVYDKTSGLLIQPTIVALPAGRNLYQARWTSIQASSDVRLIFHVASTNTAVWDLTVDRLLIGPGVTGQGFSDSSAQLAGTIQSYAGSTASWLTTDGAVQSNGWALADGSVLSSALYPDIAEALGTTWATCARQDGTGGNYAAPAAGFVRLPDLRGVFLRGVGTSSRADGSGDVTVALGAFTNDRTGANGLLATASVVTGTTNIGHSHGASALNASTPSTTSGNQSADHSHTFSGKTSIADNLNTGQASRSIWYSSGIGIQAYGQTNPTGAPMFTDDENHAHDFGGTTSGMNVSHSHNIPAMTVTGTATGQTLGATNVSLASGTAVAQVISSTELETAPRNVGVNQIVKLWNAKNVNVLSENKQSPIRAGSVLPFAGATPPPGWLLCDGAEYSQVIYPHLFRSIGTLYATQVNAQTGVTMPLPAAGNFRTPDYRTLFLRGTGTNSMGVTTTLGGWQDDATARNGLTPGNLSGTFTSGGISANHTHDMDFMSQDHDRGHTHTFTTANAGHHSHNALGTGPSSGAIHMSRIDATAFCAVIGGAQYYATTAGGSTNPLIQANGTHSHVGTTDGANTGHLHRIAGTTGTVSSNHTHDTTVTFNSPGLTGDAETRPQNRGVTYIIKAWDDSIDLFGFAFADTGTPGMISASPQKISGRKAFLDGVSLGVPNVLTAAGTISTLGLWFINSASNAVFPLLSAVGLDGFEITIKNIGAGIATIDPNGAELIEFVATKDLLYSDSITIVAYANNWYVK